MKKKIIYFLLLFVFLLIWNLIFMPLNNDEIWNYGFSLAIFNGEVPYRDFNMILTPLYPFIMSFVFLIFGSSEIVFHVCNVGMILVLFYLLNDLFGEKCFWYLFFLCFPMSIIFPSYNIFLFILFVLLIWCEKNRKSDYLIGLILACLCLTKQTVGVCLSLVGLFYYLKDRKRLFKRMVAFLIPCFVFLIYLLVSKSLIYFLDLCLFGLFDFTKGNGTLFNIYVLLFLILFFLTIVIMKKNPRKIENWYILAFYSIMLPLFDLFHFQFGFIAFIMLIMINEIKLFKFKFRVKLFVVGCFTGICLICFQEIDWSLYPNDIKYFSYRYIKEEALEFTNEVVQFMEDQENKKIIFLNPDGYYFRIITDDEITYLDLINRGNWGYNGSKKLLMEVKKNKKAIFLVNEDELDSRKQSEKEAIKYVIKNGKKIDSIKIYDVYIFE